MKNRAFFVQLVCIVACLTATAPLQAKTPSAKKAMSKQIKNYALTGTLDQACAKLGKLGKIKVRIDWPALKAAGVKRDCKVMLKGKKAKLSDIVDLMLTQVMVKGKRLAWQTQGETLWITSRKQLKSVQAKSRAKRKGKNKPATKPAGLNLNMQNTPLSDVIEAFRQFTGANFHVNWRSLQIVGLKKSTPITLKVKNVTVAKALDLVMAELNADKEKLNSVYWIVDQNIVEIATGAVLNQRMRTRIYNVGDLLHVTPESHGTRVKPNAIGESISNSEGETIDMWDDDEDDDEDKPKPKSMRKLRKERREALIKIIKDSIGEDMWLPEGKGSINIHKKRLVITQSLLGFKMLEKSLGR